MSLTDAEFWQLVTALSGALSLASAHGLAAEACEALEEYAALFHDGLSVERQMALDQLLAAGDA